MPYCACDVCRIELTPQPSAHYRDGLCEWCGVRCFPQSSINGSQAARIVLARGSRIQVHAQALPQTTSSIQLVSKEIGQLWQQHGAQLVREGLQLGVKAVIKRILR